MPGDNVELGHGRFLPHYSLIILPFGATEGVDKWTAYCLPYFSPFPPFWQRICPAEWKDWFVLRLFKNTVPGTKVMRFSWRAPLRSEVLTTVTEMWLRQVLPDLYTNIAKEPLITIYQTTRRHVQVGNNLQMWSCPYYCTLSGGYVRSALF
jgi:hypothetical protein